MPFSSLHQITKNVGIELPEFLGQINRKPSRSCKNSREGKGRRSKKKSQNQIPNYESKSKTDLEIENLLKENKELLNTFDQNNDGIIDHTEIN